MLHTSNFVKRNDLQTMACGKRKILPGENNNGNVVREADFHYSHTQGDRP